MSACLLNPVACGEALATVILLFGALVLLIEMFRK